MPRSVSILLIGLIGLIPGSSFGFSSVCSNPARARVLARATIFLPSDNIGTLEHRFAIIAPKIGMSTWGTGLDERGKILVNVVFIGVYLCCTWRYECRERRMRRSDRLSALQQSYEI